jgi:hypothetical protein
MSSGFLSFLSHPHRLQTIGDFPVSLTKWKQGTKIEHEKFEDNKAKAAP